MNTMFAFKFLIESVSIPPDYSPCGDTSVRFRLLEFPDVAISLTGLNLAQQRSEKHCLVKRGKACLFQSSIPNLVTMLHDRMVRVEFVVCRTMEGDTECDPEVKGVAYLNIHKAAAALEKTLEGSGKRCSGTERKELVVLDHTGKRVISLHVKYQLTMAPGHGDSSSSLTRCDVDQPSTHQPSSTAGCKEEATSSEGHTSDNNDHNEDLYLTNSVCPPPLFYHSDSQPPTNDSKKDLGVDGFKDCTVVGAHIHQESWSDTKHWLALMRHDNSHPLNSTLSSLARPVQRASEEQEEKAKHASSSDSERVTSLPLLSALLTELTLLKSHVEPCQTQPASEMIEKLLLQRKTEMVSKCMQTVADRTPLKHHHKLTSDTHTTSNNRSQNIKNPAARKFVRECCAYRHADAHYTAVVPKNKSVLYPPDIAHKRIRNFARKQLKNASATTCNHRREDLQQKTTHRVRKAKNKRHTAPLKQQTPPTKTKPPSPAPVQDMKSLEVFIPQASMGSPLSSRSRSSICSQKQDEVKTAVVPVSMSDIGVQTCITRSVETQTYVLSEDMLSQNGECASEAGDDSVATGTKHSQTSTDHPSSDHHHPIIMSPPPPVDSHSSTTINITDEDKEPSKSEDVPPVDIIITKPPERPKKELSLSQEPPTPPRNKSTDNLPLMLPYGKKHNSLLNIASQTLDSFMSMDSLDGLTSAVLPAHRVLYLATSQSTSLDLTGADGTNEPVGLAADSAGSLDNDALDIHNKEEYSSLSYSDDFEEFESDSGTQSSSQ